MRQAIAHHAPANVRREADGTITFDADEGLQLTGRLLLPDTAGRHRATVLVQSQPAPSERARALVNAGEVVLILLPRGVPAPAAERLTGDWITNVRASLVGRSLAAMRAHDILCGVDIVLAQPEVDGARIRAEADGTAGAWLLMAAASDARIGGVNLVRTPYNLRSALDNPLSRGLHDIIAPGALLKWDFEDLAAAMKGREVIWTDPVDWMRNPVVRPGARYTNVTQ
jgi:hypothetical protein